MSFSLYRPETAAEAVALQCRTGGAYLAGGTVTLVNRHQGKDINPHQISLEEICELHTIRETEDAIQIGACVTMSEIEASDTVGRWAEALRQAAAQVGGPQVRNRATIGGNLAAGSPAADTAPALLALGAQLNILSSEGPRTLPVEQLFSRPFVTTLSAEELILSVSIPKRIHTSRFAKVGKRNALAISCITMAVVKGETWQVAVGAAAPTPVLCREASAALNGGGTFEERLEAACEAVCGDIAPIDDRWATASYRRKVCRNLLRATARELEVEA